jgi:hypothetical protein
MADLLLAGTNWEVIHIYFISVKGRVVGRLKWIMFMSTTFTELGYLSQYSMTTDWTTGVLSPAKEKEFSCDFCVQNSSEAHPASCTMGTRGSLPG